MDHEATKQRGLASVRKAADQNLDSIKARNQHPLILWQVTGLDSTSGEGRSFQIEADTEDSAIRRGNRKGLMVSHAVPVTSDFSRPAGPVDGKSSTISQSHQSPAKRSTSPDKSTLGGIKWLIAGMVTFLLLAVGLAVFSFFGHSATRDQWNASEVALMKAVDSADVDGVKENLTDEINWHRVAPALLNEIISDWNGHILPGSSVESNEEKGKREFWESFAERCIQNGANVNEAIIGARNLGALQYLIGHGADLNAASPSGHTAIRNCIDTGTQFSDLYLSSVNFLISKGANVNCTDADGNSPLHLAAKSNSVKEIGLLLSAGARVNEKNKTGQTPYGIANLLINTDAAKLLKSAGGSE